MRLWTIGFTQKTAEEFFDMLRDSGVKRVVDVRLHNASQLAGFAKKQDLAYFLKNLCGIEYVHEPLLAPTQEMFEEYKKKGGSWQVFEGKFLDLMEERKIEKLISPEVIAEGCLLCSEDKPHNCHRKLVADYLSSHWGSVDVKHLV